MMYGGMRIALASLICVLPRPPNLPDEFRAFLFEGPFVRPLRSQ